MSFKIAPYKVKETRNVTAAASAAVYNVLGPEIDIRAGIDILMGDGFWGRRWYWWDEEGSPHPTPDHEKVTEEEWEKLKLLASPYGKAIWEAMKINANTNGKKNEKQITTPTQTKITAQSST